MLTRKMCASPDPQGIQRAFARPEITIVTAATIMAYRLYTLQGPTGNHWLMVTIPLGLYGMFRYLVSMRMEGASPEELLLRDRHML